jgi:ribA/ribD-fused uncharacterized protein
MSRTVPLVIDSFVGDFAFLDNCYPCNVFFDGLNYPSAEHAYQASKTEDPNRRLIIANLLDGATARSYGKSHLKITTEFSLRRLDIMRSILQAKFFDNIPLAKMLIETMESTLLYPARGNDLFWGCRSKGTNGENQLGKILMAIRSQMREATKRAADARMSRVKFSGGLGITDPLKARLQEVTGIVREAVDTADAEPPVTGGPPVPPPRIQQRPAHPGR